MGRKEYPIRDAERRRVYKSKYESDYHPSAYSGMPHSLFWLARWMLMGASIIALIFVLVDFNANIGAFLKLFIPYIIVEVICRVAGWHKVD